MQFDQLREAWRRELEHDSGGLDVEGLTRLVERLDRDFEKTISRRDFLETAIALALLPFFGWLAMKPPLGLRSLGGLITLAGLILIVVMLWLARRAGTNTAGPLSFADSLLAERERVARQVRLLKNVAGWYVAPVILGVNLIVSADCPLWQLSAAYVIATVLFGVFIWWLNQRAVRRVLQPMLDEIDSVRECLASEGQSEE